MMIDATELCILILVTMSLIQGHRNAEKQRLLCLLSQSYEGIWMECGMLSRFVGLMNHIFLSDMEMEMEESEKN